MTGKLIKKEVLIMRDFVGDGELKNGEKIQLTTTFRKEPIVEFESGEKVLFGWAELIELANLKRNETN